MIEKIENLTSIEQFFKDFPQYNSHNDKDNLIKAWMFMLERRENEIPEAGNSAVEHPIRMARILASLGLDNDTIICALLYGEPAKLQFTKEEVIEFFGEKVNALLEATVKFSDVKLYNKTGQRADTICKMLFSMVDDIRVMIIQLAERLDKIRYLSEYPEERQRPIAAEISEIWAPLAQRLGISTIQNELEDLSLKYLNREAFDQIKKMVSAKKKERESFLANAEKEVYKVISRAGLEVKVQTRAKHFWSIYRKMKKRNKAADELFDLLAMRILCSTINECYTVLGLVHTIWKPLEGRFKDYIAMPKANGYQSLHTTVICDEGQTLEIQIRTYDMHEVAERGIASHWIYKEHNTHKQTGAAELSFVRQLKELSKKEFNNDEFLTELKNDLLGDTIYVFTPRADIIELPAGATAIDFAYAIHSAVGEKIVSAKADGSIIPLSRPLKNTQVIEVITHPHAHPTRNQYANAKTSRARQKIRAWLQAHEELAPPPEKEEKNLHRPARTVAEESKKTQDFDPAILKIRVGDSSNFMVKFAQCCSPKPPDAVCGYVSRGRGVIIHRENCPNLAKIPDIADRKIEVEWEKPKTPKQKKSGTQKKQ
ncbi:bifunctional (p)ppGpp synthetase/guanosine-3',5'-bis(diphosphate) 3'-pyrophosphohydrolase [Treponema phagedenis]|uniref:RelA/SpoT family protein n=1 Tax=Treponema phagedenis TaxID=162 RepID=A0A0B7GUV5_TREPH|nr:RelA/SpoT family protein [Treponema phagedenis]QEJ94365.1 bifunctional (p)ppGpp synthetase/guanosine-3',5'-bis(diphosphate) 3'-pyrophosphohydrolase [Treponema phagedenis]QEK04438.1 bifunctional (p)ppGpp synthetase/guanosine-3',5'-bis(diphosphate) 3'-pyrophosphohydrolase [Treponema phagedenis]QEK10093.1 bifunctional (p)ppGpp synthetase/guanosine-3',5'-bis(diphosphate) 3'-pyrophosphohydrolase [Treponema phagedenis]QSH98618.1 bifunctional (p)ppGpp synthetase/guanosine-3',5'-bis(diphosphate) 3'-